MKKALVLLLLVFGLTACVQNDNEEDDFLDVKEVSSYEKNTYYLDLDLDVSNFQLDVTGTIVYVNTKRDYDELNITLFPNADNARGHGDNVIFDYLKIDGVSYDVVFSGDDHTNIHVDLAETLKKDENFLIEFHYTFTYWDYGRILGVNDYFVTMFFYPYVAMYDEEGWHIETYSFLGESYYNDIGDYFVQITHPLTYQIASSGFLMKQETVEDKGVSYYQLYNARDFSFSASSSYRAYRYELDDVSVEIYSMSALSDFELRRVESYIEDAFNTFETYIGEYPYTHYTLEIGHIFGMESTEIGYVYHEISEETIVHEILHQWLYSIIGSNQADYSIIDEGLTTFVTGFYYKEVYGDLGETRYYTGRSSLKKDFTERYNRSLGTSMVRFVDDYGEDYGYIVYYHGTTMYKYFFEEFLNGDYELFKTFLQAYYDTYKYDNVTLDEMLTLLEDSTNEPMTKEWFTLMLDEIQDFENRPSE